MTLAMGKKEELKQIVESFMKAKEYDEVLGFKSSIYESQSYFSFIMGVFIINLGFIIKFIIKMCVNTHIFQFSLKIF